MNKELIELQRGCFATCIVIKEENYKELEQGILMDANISDAYLFASPLGKTLFTEKLEEKANNGKLTYFIIRGITKLSFEMQNRYVTLVKDREFHGYKLPDNVILVFTVASKEDLKNISKELYHFCVVAF